jgi:hypothetical protein
LLIRLASPLPGQVSDVERDEEKGGLHSEARSLIIASGNPDALRQRDQVLRTASISRSHCGCQSHVMPSCHGTIHSCRCPARKSLHIGSAAERKDRISFAISKGLHPVRFGDSHPVRRAGCPRNCAYKTAKSCSLMLDCVPRIARSLGHAWVTQAWDLGAVCGSRDKILSMPFCASAITNVCLSPNRSPHLSNHSI